MDLGLEASAIVVRFGATATSANMREFALLGREIARDALKPEADLFIVKLLVEILPEINGELHEILEVFLTTWSRGAFSLPFLALAVPSASFHPLRARGRSRKSKHRRTSTRRLVSVPFRGEIWSGPFPNLQYVSSATVARALDEDGVWEAR